MMSLVQMSAALWVLQVSGKPWSPGRHCAVGAGTQPGSICRPDGSTLPSHRPARHCASAGCCSRCLAPTPLAARLGWADTPPAVQEGGQQLVRLSPGTFCCSGVEPAAAGLLCRVTLSADGITVCFSHGLEFSLRVPCGMGSAMRSAVVRMERR